MPSPPTTPAPAPSPASPHEPSEELDPPPLLAQDANDHVAPTLAPSPALAPSSELDPELLLALGEAADDVPVYGPDIHDTLARRWLPILKKGLQSEVKEKLLKDYAVPSNCKLLKAPSLNPEISAAVADIVRGRDKKIQTKQDQLGLGITAINRAMTSLLTSDDKVQAVKILSDGCRILTDLHFIETQVRTKLITPGLDKSFLTVIKDHDRDETLFGNTLPEKIKASKAIERQGHQIKKTAVPKASTSNAPSSLNSRPRAQGNWAGPPRYQSSSRGGRTPSYPYRGQYRRAPPATSTPPFPQTRSSTSTATNKRAPARQ